MGSPGCSGAASQGVIPSHNLWSWNERSIGWSLMGDPNAEEAVLLIHGFGANTNHWRFNQPVLAELQPTYAIDLLGFGRSDQPRARLKDCLLYTSPSPRDMRRTRMPSSA